MSDGEDPAVPGADKAAGGTEQAAPETTGWPGVGVRADGTDETERQESWVGPTVAGEDSPETPA